MYAHVTLMGYIGGDAEMRYTPEGTAVSSFNMAISRKRKGEDVTFWVRVSFWGKMAESLTEYLTKGKRVLVDGDLEMPRAYLDKNSNEPVAQIQVTAREIKFAESRGDNAGSNGGTGKAPAQASRSVEDIGDEDIPF